MSRGSTFHEPPLTCRMHYASVIAVTGSGAPIRWRFQDGRLKVGPRYQPQKSLRLINNLGISQEGRRRLQSSSRSQPRMVDYPTPQIFVSFAISPAIAFGTSRDKLDNAVLARRAIAEGRRALSSADVQTKAYSIPPSTQTGDRQTTERDVRRRPDKSAGETARKPSGVFDPTAHPDERSLTQALLNFPEDSGGRLMTSEFLAIPEEWTARRVIDHMRTHGEEGNNPCCLGARSFGQTQRRYSNPADFVVLSRRSSFDENKAKYQSRHALGKEKALMSDEYENPFIGVSNQAIIQSLSGTRRRSPGDPTRSDPALGAKLAFDSSGFFIWTSCFAAPVCRASAIWLMVLS